jgi:hypothetical protein
MCKNNHLFIMHLLIIVMQYAYCFNFNYSLGLYLYVLVIKTFMAESIKLRTYILIGWGKESFDIFEMY